MKKIISIIILLIYVLSAIPVIADDNVMLCVYDMYTENAGNKKGAVYENSEALFIGDTYERRAFMTFDISSYSNEYKGYILSLTVRNNVSGTQIILSDGDGNFLGSSVLEKTGKIKCEFVVTKYIESLASSGKTTADFILKGSSDTVTVFASESTDKAARPHIRATVDEAYVPGQKDFAYPTVSTELFAEKLNNTVAGGHPYLFGRKDDFERVKKYIADGDYHVTDWYNKTKDYAGKYVGKTPDAINISTSYLSRGELGKNIVTNCAFVYLVDGDETFARRAYEEASLFANLPSWGTYQYIDNNQIAFAVALCYDWLYDWLNPQQRQTLIDGLCKNHLDTLLDLYRNPKSSKYTAGFYQTNFANENHAVLDNCSTFLEALAIADADINYSAEIMHNNLINLEKCFDKIYPDGAWYEGLNYWSYVGPYIARVLSSMESAFGEHFGYEKIPCIVNLADFSIYGQSSQGVFVFNDASQGKLNPQEIFYLGKVKNDLSQQKRYLDSSHSDSYARPLLCLWYDAQTDYSGGTAPLPKDKFFRNTDMVTMRSDFEGKQETYGAMLVQKASLPHGVINSGTIAFDALGERWVTNPGADNYDLPGYWDVGQSGKRWKYYFSRAEANSCFVVNPSDHGGQNVKSDDTINTYVSKPKGAFAISDLTDTYKDFVSSYKRGVALTGNRTKFVIQDEAEFLDKSEAYSFVNVYMSDIQIVNNGKDAILSKDNKHVYVNVESDKPYKLEILRADGLPGSDLLEGGKYIKDIKRIGIHFENIENVKCKIELIPYLTEKELSYRLNDEITPLENWSEEDGEYNPPMLDTITADGKPIEFNPYERCIRLGDEEAFPKIIDAVSKNSEVDIKCVSEDLRYEIFLKDYDGNINSYIVYKDKPIEEKPSIDVSMLSELKIKGVSASADDGNIPSNVIDGKDDTRWSASGKQYLDIELSEKTKLSCIGIAFYEGTKRRAYFELQVSDDGKEWHSLGETESSGKTEDFEYYSLEGLKGKYVRILGFGNNTSTWNSILEVKVYK